LRVNTLQYLSRAYDSDSRLEEARDLAAEALALTIRHYGDDAPKTADAHSYLANTYNAMANDSKAAEHSYSAAQIYADFYGKDHTSYITVMANYANSLVYLERLDEAEPILLDTTQAFLKSFGADSPRYINLVTTLDKLYLKQKRPELAKEQFQTALPVYLATYGEKNSWAAMVLSNLGDTYHQLGDEAAALEHLDSALDMLAAQNLGEHHLTTLLIKAEINCKKDSLECVRDAQQALLIFNQTYGPEHPKAKQAAALIESAKQLAEDNGNG